MSKSEFTFDTTDEKKVYVRQMFSDIAGRYDFLNHFLSFGQDFRWRKKAVRVVRKHLGTNAQPAVLDIACGTGDLSFEVLRQMPGAKITGLDLARPMLDIFQQKIDKRHATIVIGEGDVEALEFADNTFDAVTIGFATRNFSKLDVACREIFRVLKPGGVFVNLELSKPRRFPMKQLYAFYSRFILPIVGKGVSRNTEAYSYLPDSIRRFPEREEIVAMLTRIGFVNARWKDLSAGIVTMHIAEKR
ncbi:MAG: bifunctional demethylmenaquinone methyltransferase/2-methoxy-6-polyprenyl-1,4-benzoquinol methylase UbiE [Bacteroidetes bacterium]|nr:bifunctional demethylmenaquinone methyltransferase/2-methoxy-6-polyprenyl-1,4-benzoquinol methylase UbiE [Bacteroidota bacterium]